MALGDEGQQIRYYTFIEKFMVTLGEHLEHDIINHFIVLSPSPKKGELLLSFKINLRHESKSETNQSHKLSCCHYFSREMICISWHLNLLIEILMSKRSRLINDINQGHQGICQKKIVFRTGQRTPKIELEKSP
jgi:hypothetical protein